MEKKSNPARKTVATYRTKTEKTFIAFPL